jgi:hypothetical protein
MRVIGTSVGISQSPVTNEASEEPRSSLRGFSKEKAIMGVATPIPRFPFIPATSYRVFWFFPINPYSALNLRPRCSREFTRMGIVMNRSLPGLS